MPWPTTSPAAYTFGALVRMNSSTATKPRASVATPAAARSSPAVSAIHPAQRTASCVSTVRCSNAVRTPPGTRFEGMDATAIFVDVDAVFAVGTRQLRGNVLVFGGRNTRAGLTQDDRRAERIENRRNLHAGCTRTDNEQRFRRRLQRKGVCRRYREFAARYVQRAADAAGTDHDGVRVQNETRFAFERLPIDEPCRSGALEQRYARSADLLEQRRSLARFADHFARSRHEAHIVEHRWLVRHDAVPAELPRFAHEPRRVCQRPNGNRPFVCRHASERFARNQRGLSSELCRAQRGGRAGRSGPDRDDVEPLRRAHAAEARCCPACG